MAEHATDSPPDWGNGFFEVPPMVNWAQQQRDLAQHPEQQQGHGTAASAPPLHAPRPMRAFPAEWAQTSAPNPPTWPPSLFPPTSLPPTTTADLLNLPSTTATATAAALTETSSDPYAVLSSFTGPPVLHSSFGPYEVISGPYARFLTPSPGPSVLDAFEEFDRENEQDGFPTLWRDYDSPASGPFASMSAARSDSASSFAAVDLHQRRREAFDAYERSIVSSHPPLPPSLPIGFDRIVSPNDAPPASFTLPPLQGAVPPRPTSIPPQPPPDAEEAPATEALLSAPTSGRVTPEGASPLNDLVAAAVAVQEEAKPKTQRKPKPKTEKPPSKKNRNPHATQLPGAGARKLPKLEATDDHEGPSCSHCASVSTPLWRRGPDDELLCNACGLYLKLHGKPRPKAFGKKTENGPLSTRGGIVAQTIAAGVTPSCHNCSATSTPMWRKDAEGFLACNACSLYYKLHNVLRPISLARKQKPRESVGIASTSATASNSSSGDEGPPVASTSETPPSPPVAQKPSTTLSAAAWPLVLQ